MDSYWALAAFAGWILLGFVVYFIIAQRLEIERLEKSVASESERADYQREVSRGLYGQLEALKSRFAPFDPDGDGRPGGRKRHDPYIDR